MKNRGDHLTSHSQTFYVSKLVPELHAQLQRRYRILQMIQASSPVGRRALADMLHLTERVVRNETMILKQEDLIEIKQTGMICTELGNKAVEELRNYIHEISGLTDKELQLAQKLQVKQAIIVSGEANTPEQLSLLGKEAAQRLTYLANDKDIIAVTGGTTVAAIAPHLTPVAPMHSVQFIAARGGLGSTLHDQANTIVANFGQQTNAMYKSLFVPENLSQESYEAIRNEPVIKEVTDLYHDVNIVVHGIGNAAQMAQRRNSSQETIEMLNQQQATSEAFGYYFNAQGDVVHKLPSIGINLQQVKKASTVIAIAAGKDKVDAIKGYFKHLMPQTYFITDEVTANAILNE